MKENMKDVIEKLNAKYIGSKITELANAGDYAGAQERAAQSAMWGLWHEIGAAANLPHSYEDRAAWIAAFKARRAAKFNRT